MNSKMTKSTKQKTARTPVRKDLRYLSGKAWLAGIENVLPNLTPKQKKDFERHGREIRKWG